MALYEKVNNTYNMHDEAREILLICLDRLADMHRCSDGKKEEYAAARKMLKGATLPIDVLFKMNIPTMRKIKFIPYSLLGAGVHCFIFATLKKKLC